MNLTQIRAVYLSRLNEKLSHCFAQIDAEMISNYRKIEAGESFKMTGFSMNRSYEFPDDYKEDMVSEIMNHYVESWNITHFEGNKKDHPYFVFEYKGHPAGYAEHIVLKEVIIADSKESEPLDRTQMLDIRE